VSGGPSVHAPVTVLVASGDEGVRSQVRLTLGDERFEVHETHDTEGTIRALATERPQVLVVDLTLPGRGALALARSARSQPETADVSTLVLVPRGEHVDEEADGVDATLAVPTTSFALLRKIDGLVVT
jgi:DNA-binding response OmpR family regulator